MLYVVHLEEYLVMESILAVVKLATPIGDYA